jgi:DNA-binding CsgD family transcriptional regulator
VGRFDQEEHSHYVRNYAARDIRLPRIFAKTQGQPSTDKALITPEKIRNCPVYNEFFQRLDIYHFLGITSRPTRHGYGILAVLRPQPADPYDQEQMSAFQELGQHFGQALRIHLRLGSLEARVDTLSRALDTLTFALLVTDAMGNVRLANARAERVLQEADGLLTRAGKLTAASRRASTRLRQFIDAAASATNGKRTSPGGTLLVPRPPFRSSLQLLIAPLPRSGALIGEEPNGAAAILITDPDEDPPSMREALTALFDLTPAEARLTEALATGSTLRQHADAERISFETARTHLKRVFDKTGVHRQSDLVALVQKSPLALVRRPPRIRPR